MKHVAAQDFNRHLSLFLSFILDECISFENGQRAHFSVGQAKLNQVVSRTQRGIEIAYEDTRSKKSEGVWNKLVGRLLHFFGVFWRSIAAQTTSVGSSSKQTYRLPFDVPSTYDNCSVIADEVGAEKVGCWELREEIPRAEYGYTGEIRLMFENRNSEKDIKVFKNAKRSENTANCFWRVWTSQNWLKSLSHMNLLEIFVSNVYFNERSDPLENLTLPFNSIDPILL